MAKTNYLVEGLSGTGKSSVYDELTRRGYSALSADRTWGYAEPITGLANALSRHDNWKWGKARAIEVLKSDEPDILFVCGSSRNRDDFLLYFSKVFNLKIDDETMVRRLADRTNNDFGKVPEEVQLMLALNRKGEKPVGAIDIDANKPLKEVVDEMLSLCGLGRARTQPGSDNEREEAHHVKLHEFPRYPLMFGPSPIHQLDRLTKHLGGATVWAKREDCNSGLAFGGNKTRKLEYIVPDALAKGADTLVSIGGVQSNHTRQVAAVAAKLGLKCRLVQEKWVDWDDPVNDRVGNILLSRIMGADVRLGQAGFDIGIRSSWEEAVREVEKAGGRPYGIPAGASEHPLGGLGFANWAFELAEQERQLGVFFDTIIVCTVTGSTHAGMIAGFAALEEVAHGRPRRVLGIDASARIDQTRDQVARIARGTAKLIELGRDLSDDEIVLLEGWAGDLYGIPVESTIEAIRLSGSLEAMIIDPVYEGKSMAGLIDLVSSGEIPKDSTVLYAHLGGQPALNAYPGIFD